MSIQPDRSDDITPPQPWLRYRGKLAFIETTGIVDGRAEGPLLVLAASAASRGSATVVLNLTRARLDEDSVPVLVRMKECLGASDVAFALAGPSRAARVVLAGAEDDLDLMLYPSVSAPAPWSSSTWNAASQLQW
jgi:hypothetical protein